MTTDLVSIPAGGIFLHDEGSRRSWRAEVDAFLLSATLVTLQRYGSVMPINYSAEQKDLPVSDVSWNDAVRFCNLLSEHEGLTPCYAIGADDPEARSISCDVTASGYRLPTEAEWEHACRAGSNDERYGELDTIAWHKANAGERLHDVASKLPNAWGLYDMIGDAWEWCWDVYDPSVYGPYRVFRGGGFADEPHACRASCRRKSHPTFRVDDLGFRLARRA